MPKTGKKFDAAAKQVEARPYSLQEAIPLVQKIKFAKFDETVEVHMRLGVDPKHADQQVRGTIVLPNGLGRSKKVLVIASGDKQREATEAGADIVGGEEIVQRIQAENWTDYDAVVATPDMMRSVGRLGKILGPRGLMPNPKTGTVTTDVTNAVREIKAGKVEFRVDKTGVIHAPVGKVSFTTDKLFENANMLIQAVVRAKPSAAKGKYVKSVTVCSTMGPGVPLDVTVFNARQAYPDRGLRHMKDRDQKEKDLAQLREEFERANSIFLTGYEKMTVQQDFELRKAVRGAGGDYHVIKNTLAEKAAEGKPVRDLMKELAGMN